MQESVLSAVKAGTYFGTKLYGENVGRYVGLGSSIVAGRVSYGALSTIDKSANISELYPQKISDTNPPNGSLSDVETREWHLGKEATIADAIDNNAPLEAQAHQAFDLRNQYRTQARTLMADRNKAINLDASEPNMLWDAMIQKQIDKGYSGDQIFQSIFESAQKSRVSVNSALNLDPNNLNAQMIYPLKPSDFLRGSLDGFLGVEIGGVINDD